MIGNAEKRDGMARKLRNVLKIGYLYSIKDLAGLIGNDPRGMQGGVIPKDDAQLLLVTLLDPKYPDEIINDTLHWYGQESQERWINFLYHHSFSFVNKQMVKIVENQLILGYVGCTYTVEHQFCPAAVQIIQESFIKVKKRGL